MTWYPAYLTKQDIVDVISDRNYRLTTGDIKDVDVRAVDSEIFRKLTDAGITVNYTGTVSGSALSPTDINSYLWSASLYHALEFLSKRGLVTDVPGGIHLVKNGNKTRQYARQQPMFFLGQGSLNNLDKVMPYRSYKQIAQSFIESFIKAYYKNTSDKYTARPVNYWDSSSRGFGANASIDNYIKAADREFDTGIV